ncbi:MAG: exodeoxyribonuclease V subunit gamma [Phycisphaerae bacterium]|nr:exodeoxyribonuclease V subunit gamma [Phycisphaerae bacterium]
MAVQFILGRSGTGKTSYCIKAIADALTAGADNQPLILLVPEQATYQAERAILSDKRAGGYHRLHVLSFARLQFLLSGKRTAKPMVTQTGQQMIIQRILRANKSKLKVFGSSAGFPGLGRQMAKTIAELHEYAKTPEDIEQLLGQLRKDERNSLAVLKFSDIGLVLREYLKFIEDRFIDPDIELNRSRQAAANSDLTKGAKLWVDGFAGFTTSELAILTELLKAAADAQIALCLDPSNIDLAKLDMTSMFSPTEQTYTELIETVKKNKLQLVEPIILKEGVRFSCSEELGHIEREIFKLKPAKVSAGGAVRIISAPNVRAEVQFVAREILRLLKEKDYRYRDIAVIASDIDHYEHYITACFEDYGIPFFIDKRRSLNQHPAIGLICSALQVVLNGFSHSDIFSFLKTDMAPIERSEADLLENYCLAFGVTGADWANGQDWNFAGDGDKQLDQTNVNRIRLKVGGPLLELRDKLCPIDNPTKTITAEELVRVIFDFIETLGIRGEISKRIEQATERKDYAAVDEHRQFYNKLIDIFDTLAEVFSGQEETARDYLAILDSAFSQMELAFIPPTLDEVFIGSIRRSRQTDLKAVFLIGANQKEFPVPVSFESILTDDDRIAAKEAKFQLAATTGQKLSERQYLAYIAFTRPSQLLCVTYPSTDEGGSATTRSQFIDNLAALFENLKEKSIAGNKNNIEEVYSKNELSDLLCSQLGKDGYRDSRLVARDSIGTSREQLSGLLDGICLDEELAELGTEVQSAINYGNVAQLDKRIVDALFGKQMKSSATRLSTFAACPYKYFAKYVLQLGERKECKLRPLDMGDFYHRVLDALSKKLNDLHKDFASVEKAELLELLREQISVVVQTNSFISNFSRHSRHNAYIIQSVSEYLDGCVAAIAEMVRAGSFRPKWSEVSFGHPKEAVESIGDYKLTLPNGWELLLDGKIDRIDVANVDGQNVAVIFDYKRSQDSAKFDWSKFYHGLNMQLLIYILAANKADKSKINKAVGAFFIPIEAHPKTTVFTKLAEKAGKFQYKANGLFNGEFSKYLDSMNSNKYYNFFVKQDGNQYGYDNISGAIKPDDFEKIMKFTEDKFIGFVQEILSGKIDIHPYRLAGESACKYCEYKAVCRFDWQVNEYNFWESSNKLETLEKIKGANG